MSILLQQGYGMMKMNLELSKEINDLGVILSPRALQKNTDIESLEKHAEKLKQNNVKILFDPQFYVPRTNLEKILKFPYFKGINNYETMIFKANEAKTFIENVVSYQINKLCVDEVIIPNIYTNSINEDWYDIVETFIDDFKQYTFGKFTYLTVPIGADVVKNKGMFDELISRLTQYDVDGYYFVFKSPKGFLIDEEDYLYALLDAFISLNLAKKKVIIGYANQQDLIFSAAGVSAIASGNFRNVRSFDPEIFFEEENSDETKRRGTWYYDGNTLSEYKVQQLILAQRRNIGGIFGPHCKFCENLLKDPITALWKENDAFKHYLYEINRQWASLNEVEPNSRIDRIIEMLSEVDERVEYLERKGFRLGERAFNKNLIEANLTALTAIKSDREFEIKSLVQL